jgi:nucleoside-diphosphate-sugar epimerase
MAALATLAEASAFAGRTICVTGGAGFIGSNLVEHLASAGADVVVVDNFFSGKRENLAAVEEAVGPGRIRLHEIDIRDRDALGDAMRGCDTVFHLAALGSVPLSVEQPELANAVNAQGSLSVYAAARQNGIKRVVVSASSAAYGDDPTLPKREDLPPHPESPYATSKLAMEYYGINATKLYGMEVAILRYFNVFGPRQDPNSQYAAVIPIFAARLLANQAPIIFGDGEQTRDFVHVDDVVRANLLAAGAPASVCAQPMNIAGGARITVNHLFRKISHLLGVNLAPIYQPERLGDVRHSVADVSRARTLMGFEAKVSVDEGLERSIDWYRTHLS